MMGGEKLIDRIETLDGAELVLYERRGVFTMRVNGYELMSSRNHVSEDALARCACHDLVGEQRPRLVIGGLGMGFTLRVALEMLPAGAEVIVVEVFPEVIRWCRSYLRKLNHQALDDPRVQVVQADLCHFVTNSGGAFDAMVVDIDNGPRALSLISNAWLYSASGLREVHRCLVPRGQIVLWSAAKDQEFTSRLEKAGFDVTLETMTVSHEGRAVDHVIFVGRRA